VEVMKRRKAALNWEVDDDIVPDDDDAPKEEEEEEESDDETGDYLCAFYFLDRSIDDGFFDGMVETINPLRYIFVSVGTH
jgi:hypothetical protein